MFLTETHSSQKNAADAGFGFFRTSFKWGSNDGEMVSGHSFTQEAADTACVEQIRDQFRGISTPLYLQFRRQTIIIWRDGVEWVYGHIHDECSEPTGITLSNWTSRDEVERAARLHLAENGWDNLEQTSEIIIHPVDQTSFGDWVRNHTIHLAQWHRLFAHRWSREEASFLLAGGHPDPARMQDRGDPHHLLYEVNDPR